MRPRRWCRPPRRRGGSAYARPRLSAGRRPTGGAAGAALGPASPARPLRPVPEDGPGAGRRLWRAVRGRTRSSGWGAARAAALPAPPKGAEVGPASWGCAAPSRPAGGSRRPWGPLARRPAGPAACARPVSVVVPLIARSGLPRRGTAVLPAAVSGRCPPGLLPLKELLLFLPAASGTFLLSWGALQTCYIDYVRLLFLHAISCSVFFISDSSSGCLSSFG